MDPNATLRELLEAVKTGDVDGMIEYARALADWLEGGGFPPMPLATLIHTSKTGRR
jgi:hypothetical protein